LSVEIPFTFEGSLVTVQPVDHNRLKEEGRRQKDEGKKLKTIPLSAFRFPLSAFRFPPSTSVSRLPRNR